MISTLQEVVDHLVPDHDFGIYLVRSQVDVVLLHPKPAGQIIFQYIGGRPPADAVELGVRLSHALPRRVPPQPVVGRRFEPLAVRGLHRSPATGESEKEKQGAPHAAGVSKSPRDAGTE